MGHARISDEEWIARFRDKFGDRYEYGGFVTVGRVKRIQVICPDHGVSEQDRHFHLKDSLGCPGCRDDRSLRKLIERSTEAHGEAYTYERSRYNGYQGRSQVTCKVHGDFEFPLRKMSETKYPCPVCREGEGFSDARPITKEKFEEMLRRFGDEYTFDTSNFQNRTTGSVISYCSVHQISEVHSPTYLFSRQTPCESCSTEIRASKKRLGEEKYSAAVMDVHGSRYTYDLTEYRDNSSTIRITCMEHGEFEKNAGSHLQGVGCRRCSTIDAVMTGKWPGGYNEARFRNDLTLSSRDATVYYVRVGEQYKIGITTNLSARLRGIRSKSKKEVELVGEYQCELYKAYQIEQSILQDFLEDRISRHWTTELFNKDVLQGTTLEEYTRTEETQ